MNNVKNFEGMTDDEILEVKKAIDNEALKREEIAKLTRSEKKVRMYKKALAGTRSFNGTIDDQQLFYIIKGTLEDNGVDDDLWSNFYYNNNDNCIYATIDEEDDHYKIVADIHTTITITDVIPVD